MLAATSDATARHSKTDGHGRLGQQGQSRQDRSKLFLSCHPGAENLCAAILALANHLTKNSFKDLFELPGANHPDATILALKYQQRFSLKSLFALPFWRKSP